MSEESELSIPRATLVTRAKDALRREIVEGRLPAGSRLRETRLADRLRLSRGTLRAALGEMEREGLVQRRAYAGWSVVAFTAEDAYELYTLRQALEGLAARLAARRIDAKGRDDLLAALARLEAACATGERGAVVEADLELHFTIIAIAGHRRLSTQYRALSDQIRTFIATSDAHVMNHRPIYDEHRQLVDAILAGNPDWAESVASEHNAAAGEALYRRLQSLGRDDA